MADPVIAAEITPRAGKAAETAKALLARGFRVLHTGPTISVQAPESVWKRTFSVTFTTATRTVLREAGKTRPFRRPSSASVSIPTDLEALVVGVAFVEPPEFHGPS